MRNENIIIWLPLIWACIIYLLIWDRERRRAKRDKRFNELLKNIEDVV